MEIISVRSLAVAVIGMLSIACGSGEQPLLGKFEDPTAEFSRVRYSDRDSVSLNDRCPVSGTRLSPRIAPVYVNGRPIGFC